MKYPSSELCSDARYTRPRIQQESYISDGLSFGIVIPLMCTMAVISNISLMGSVTKWLFLPMQRLPRSISQFAFVPTRQMKLSDVNRTYFVGIDVRFKESDVWLLGLLQSTPRFYDGLI